MTTQKNIGIITQVRTSLLEVSGLKNISINEMVKLEDGSFGQVLSFDQQTCLVMLFSETKVTVGGSVTSIGRKPFVNIYPDTFGRIINPLGKLLLGVTDTHKETTDLELDISVLPLTQRRDIDEPLHSGVSIVDLLVPLSKGQREIVIGDKKTGKTHFIKKLIAHQAKKNSIIVYASIARRMSAIKEFQSFLAKEKIQDKVVHVATMPQDSAGLVYLTPYTAMAIAEHYRDKGYDVVVVFDNLTNHAHYYRQIALLAKNFPGRDSYPGDMFYTHARLLERAGNFVHPFDEKKTVAITCLPIAETVDSDLTDFIVSNLISITDGHILFDMGLFQKGHRPAVHHSLSVTRVGKQTQTPLLREINQELTPLLIEYFKTVELTHFGSDLSQDSQKLIERGESLLLFFNEKNMDRFEIVIQQILVVMVWKDVLKNLDLGKITDCKEKFSKQYASNKEFRLLCNKIVSSASSVKELTNNIHKNSSELKKLCQM
jgi:F-type H+-transporting ATPase subunit alpha